MKAVIAILAALVALGALFWFYTAPRAPVEMTEAEIAQYEAEAVQEIEAMIDAYTEAILRGDAQAVASYWTSDAVILEPGLSVEGSEIPPFFDEVFVTYRYISFDITTYEFFVHGNAAYAIGEHDQVLEAEGQEPLVHNNYDFVRYEKVDGSWKVDRLVSGPRDGPPEG